MILDKVDLELVQFIMTPSAIDNVLMSSYYSYNLGQKIKAHYTIRVIAFKHSFLSFGSCLLSSYP